VVDISVTNLTKFFVIGENLLEGLSFEVLEPFTPPVNANPDLLRNCLDWYRQCGNVTAVHGAFIDVNPASGDPEFRALSRRRCEESCRLAAELGAAHVVLHSSCFPNLRGSYLNCWAAQCADFYSELASRYGIGIRVENSQDLDPAPLKALMRRIQGSDVSLCLDIGHVNAYSKLAPLKWLKACAPYIYHYHIHNQQNVHH